MTKQNHGITFITVLLAALSIPNMITAREAPANNSVQYSCETSANFFAMNSLDYRASNGHLPQKDGLFFNSSQKEKAEALIPVTDCVVANTELTLNRVFLNMPDDSGNLCATLDWAVFQITANDEVISEFISGCSDEIHVFTTKFNLHVCKSDLNNTLCKSLSWKEIQNGNFSPIRIGLLGDWL